MLTIEYEQSLVETAVFLAAQEDAQLECAIHQVVDPLYLIADEELRHREFVPVFRDFFTKLRFDRVAADLLAERPTIGERVDRCVVREAPRRKAESAELLVQDDSGRDRHSVRTLVFQVCPESFLRPAHFVALMRRELLHVADMLDEGFGYLRETFAGDPARQNLHRDRYRVLWDIYVSGRLEREGRGTAKEKERLVRAFDRAFLNEISGADGEAFTRVFEAASLTHRDLMDWACEPALLFDQPVAS